MRITIDTTEVTSKEGTNDKGKHWEIHSQTYYRDTGKRYPIEGRLRLKDKTKPWPPGDYVVDIEASSFNDKYGRLTYSEELVLIPFGEPEVTAAKATKN